MSPLKMRSVKPALPVFVAACLAAAPAYSAPVPFVLVCLRDIPLAVKIDLEGDELARFQAYRPGMVKVAADLVSQPHPDLVKPMQEGGAIVLEGIAWDKSISAAGPDKFDVHVYPTVAQQVCRRGYVEIGRFAIP